jgi:hypothetical protein
VLSELVRREPTKVEAEYLPGFYVTFRFVGSAEIEEIAARVRSEIRGGVYLSARTEGMRQAVAAGVVGWRGLNSKTLLLLDLDLDEDRVPEELPFSRDDLEYLLANDASFNNWCQEIAFDINRMRQLRARDEEKNSLTP